MLVKHSIIYAIMTPVISFYFYFEVVQFTFDFVPIYPGGQVAVVASNLMESFWHLLL